MRNNRHMPIHPQGCICPNCCGPRRLEPAISDADDAAKWLWRLALLITAGVPLAAVLAVFIIQSWSN